MATVTGLTAARMIAIEAASVVSGAIDEDGHLILTTHGGTEIDAGNALVAVPEENLVRYLNPAGYTQATLPENYPMGVTLMHLTADEVETGGWTNFQFKWGTIQTIKTDISEIAQVWVHHADASAEPEFWIRGGNWNGWTPWRRLTTNVEVDIKIAAAVDPLDTRIEALEIAPGTKVRDLGNNTILEAAPDTDYPIGVSMLNLSTGSGWSLNGGLGLVVTFRYGTNRVRQIFYSQENPHLSWERTNHINVPGWSVWRQDQYVDTNISANWIAPTLTHSWVNYGAPFAPAGYRRKSDNIIRLRGVVRNGIIDLDGDNPIFTLPVGFRPEYQHIYGPSGGGSVLCRVDVTTDGKVFCAAGNNSYVSLDDIEFMQFQ